MGVEISAQAVKELRDKTSAGMMDCKKALQDANGDMAKAMETLRQKGLASADKKASRIATVRIISTFTSSRISANSPRSGDTSVVATV